MALKPYAKRQLRRPAPLGRLAQTQRETMSWQGRAGDLLEGRSGATVDGQISFLEVGPSNLAIQVNRGQGAGGRSDQVISRHTHVMYLDPKIIPGGTTPAIVDGTGDDDTFTAVVRDGDEEVRALFHSADVRREDRGEIRVGVELVVEYGVGDTDQPFRVRLARKDEPRSFPVLPEHKVSGDLDETKWRAVFGQWSEDDLADE